jgi:hypothetical protein
MNMNTQCNISPTQQQALIAVCPFSAPEVEERCGADPKQVDRISGKITVNVSIAWQKCR